jgi:hypothetical protein
MEKFQERILSQASFIWQNYSAASTLKTHREKEIDL